MGTEWVEFYKDHTGEWRWRVTAVNGRIIAASSEGFTRKWSAKRNYKKVRDG